MKESDIAVLEQLYLTTRQHYFSWLDQRVLSPADFLRDTAGERVWVAERDNQVVGFISVWDSENYIHNLFVLPSHARQGIGAALLKECLKNIGRPARLKCVSENVSALAFYQAMGWQIIAEGVGSDGDYELMQYTEKGTSFTGEPVN